MKRSTIALALAMLLALGACGSDSDAAAPDKSQDSSEDSSSEASAAEAVSSAAELSAEPTTTSTAKPAEALSDIRILHPETLAFAAPFTMLDTTGELAELADKVSIETWATPDVLRSVLVNGEAEMAAVPSNVGANLFNRGVDVRMAAVLVWGLIWMIGPDGTDPSWENLKGETIMIPFPNDMPDLVFRYLAEANGLVPGEDFEIEYYAQPPEVVGRLVSGGGKWAVLPEHVATLALAKGNQNGQSLARFFDLQSEWADATGSSARIPQAGVVVPGTLAEEHPEVVAALLDELDKSVDLVNAAEATTITALSEASGVPGPLVEQIIPRLNLEVVPGQEAQAELERFFTELAVLSPDIIGGSLPDSDFYLADPRQG